MKFNLDLCCDREQCSSKVTMLGCADLRIARASAERKAIDSGWKKVKKKVWVEDGGVFQNQPGWKCNQCVDGGR